MHHETLKSPGVCPLSRKNLLKLQGRLLELAHDAIIVRDPQSVIVLWNQGAEQLYGWTAREALGQETHSLLQTCFPTSRSDVQRALETQNYWEGELVHTNRQGEQLIVESRQILERDARARPLAILEINRDVTERRRLKMIEQKLQAEQQAQLDLLQLIIDELPVCVYLVQGSRARFVLSNRAAINFWGAEMKPGQPLMDFLQQQNIQLLGTNGQVLSAQELATYQAVTLNGDIRQFQQMVRRPDGTTTPILGSAITLKGIEALQPSSQNPINNSEPEKQIVLVVLQDVSILKETEKLKDEFISLATHELRTPVTILAMGADMLLTRAARGRGQSLDTQQKKIIQDMRQATRQLSKITEDMVEATRMQAGYLQLECQPTDLIALVGQVVDRLQMTTQIHQINLHTSSIDNLCVFADPYRVEQILTNLLSNAIKYSPQGGAVDVTITEDVNAHQALITIKDYGLGIPAKEQARIFRRFMRANNVKALHIGGTGLGLYLCRELIESHGGHIWFESQENEGSTFFCTLPLCDKPTA